MSSHGKLLFLFLVVFTLLIQTALTQFQTSAITTTTTTLNKNNEIATTPDPPDSFSDLNTGVSPVTPLAAGPVTCHSACDENNKCKCKVNNRILVCNCKGRYSRCGCRTWIPPTRDTGTGDPTGEKEVEVEAEDNTTDNGAVDPPSGTSTSLLSDREVCFSRCNKHKRCWCRYPFQDTRCSCHDVGKECRCMVGWGGVDADADTEIDPMAGSVEDGIEGRRSVDDETESERNNGDDMGAHCSCGEENKECQCVVGDAVTDARKTDNDDKKVDIMTDDNNKERGVSAVENVLVPRRERCTGICDARYGCFCKARNGRAHCGCNNAGHECLCRVPWRRDGDTVDDTVAEVTPVEDIPAEDTPAVGDTLVDDTVPPENIGTINTIDGVPYISWDVTPADILSTFSEGKPKVCHGVMCNNKKHVLVPGRRALGELSVPPTGCSMLLQGAFLIG
ncbi:hypothetical protein BO78DRAFT_421811 [Aspergillus sclerotiicarbonarius CBS 121057]|uniref:EGF-like domain-containing protein n=1 Tax=Aspergillus sclerotiicarbonarius (strain CBS 121057 / IBT 28362) TaxID=1448318 RepID=A0A319E140_ASPSB|nr:hypothetical protein BO78DRAFT_421811 [Aspergillus sclerotiicarbonarius CBS 121057]